jgi:hypothetical protein
MKTFILKAAAASAAILFVAVAPAQAEPVPDDPAPDSAVPGGALKLYLKDHQELPMAAVDGVPRLSAGGDLWELGGEDMQDLGEYQIIHQASGQCLTADTSGGGATVPVTLADCADAIGWTIIYHNPGHHDFRFVAAGDYLLGLRERADAVDGAEVLAVNSAPSDSMHFHEWLTESGSEATPPPSEAPGEATGADPADPSDPSDPSEVAVVPAAALPTTGVGLGVAIGSGAAALAVGAALVLWWQRRRALRADW